MKVSVIMPVCNRADNTRHLLHSLISQSIEHPAEVIVVENGSTDDMSFLNNYDIILEHCEKGISRARNLALDIATGDYLCFIDNDDDIPDDYLETVYKITESNHDWYAWQWYFDDRLVEMNDFDIKKPLKWQWSLWGYCWKKSLFDGIRFDLTDKLGDKKVFDILAKDLNGCFIRKPMYRYRWADNNDSICHMLNA